VDGAVVGAGSLFWPGATMELSPLENHAKYCIQHCQTLFPLSSITF